MSSSRGSSQPRDQTEISCIAVDSLPAELPEKPSISAHTIRCYSAFKKSDILTLATTWMKLHNIMQSEISQYQKDKNCVISFIYGI